MKTKIILAGVFGLLALGNSSAVFSHGDVAPQPVNTEGLEKLGEEEWREANPYRGNGLAVEIGSSAYNSNCARCHGLQAVSGGIAPDLRELPWAEEGDVFFVERMRNGAIRNGVTYMPKFEGVVSQEGLWTIMAWLDTVNVNKPDDFKVSEVSASDLAKVAVSSSAQAEPVLASTGKPVGDRTGQEIVNKTCATCHALGIANAPKIDPSGKAEWEKRTINGLEAMMVVAKQGKGGMPPMGADPTLTDEELKRAILHMLTLTGILAGTTEVAKKADAPKVSKSPKLVFASKKVETPKKSKSPKLVFAPKKVEAPKVEVPAKAVESSKLVNAAKVAETPKASNTKEASSKVAEAPSNDAYLKAVKEADDYTKAEIEKSKSGGSLLIEMLFLLASIVLLRGWMVKRGASMQRVPVLKTQSGR